MYIYVYNTNMNRNIINFTLLGILILVIYVRNANLVSFFNTILGRLLLILFIIILSIRDTLWGLLGLLLLIVFRESYVEGLETIQVKQTSSSTSSSNDNINLDPLIDPKDVPPNGSVSIKDVRNTTFTETVSKMLSKPKDVTPDNWRKEHCSKDNKPIQNNNIITNYKEIPNLFSNFSFVDQDCNPCDSSCNFKITSSKDAVAVSEKVRSQPSNQTIVGPSRDGNASTTPVVTIPSDGTKAGSGAVVPPAPLPVSDTSKTTPANVPGTQPQTDLNKLKQACDYRDTSKCIFDGFVKQGDSCVLQGSSLDYNAPALANYDTNTFVNWLQSLFNRNKPGTNPDNSEANTVYNYWNKCKATPGYEYLNQLNLQKPSLSIPANKMQSLPDCVVNNITIPGWKKLPDGTCIAPAGQKCCNVTTYEGQPACSANFSGYDPYWTNQWINGCIQK